MKTNKLSNITIDWKKINWLKIAPYVVALAVFIGIAMMYCSPALDGKVLDAHDVNTWKGAAHEAKAYYQETGERTWWTNSMFGGMPTYQITGSLPSGEVRNDMMEATHLGYMDQNPIGLLFAYFVGFFLMFICFGVNPWLSIVGALATGLSTYFLLIIPAGHITKAMALSYLAPVLGGFYAIMRRKYWLGIPMVLVYGFLGATCHPQITYYMGLLLGVFICAELFIHGKKREWKQLGISIGVIAVCFLLILGTKWSWMNMNNSYLKETMRGGHSELTQKEDHKKAQESAGLDYDYAMAWSYGIDETLTLLVPNMMGGSSQYNFGKDSELEKVIRKHVSKYRFPKEYTELLGQNAPIYHGDKSSTSGAVYVGAIIFFLFILALFIVPGVYKWALLFATLMSIFLAWGRHLPFLNHFFFDYFPMYNKFRTVEMILVVAEITIPLLAILGLQRIVEGKVEWKKLRNSLFIAGGLTAITCIIIAASANSINVTSKYDEGAVNSWLYSVGLYQLPKAEYTSLYNDCYSSILATRTSMLRSDAIRSLIFIVLGFGLVYGYAWLQRSFGNKAKYKVGFIVVMVGLILADLIPVNKRFFSDNDYITAKEAEQKFAEQAWEKKIQEYAERDKVIDFRVLNLSEGRTFNEARTSYRFNSIGGYSAVKLRRYQDLIERHIALGNPNVFNMLNTRYIIQPDTIITNDNAFGNAWFVDNVQFVPTPDDESNALYSMDLRTTAVADQKFRDVLSCEASPTAMDKIELIDYKPNKLTYTAYTASDRVAVFSEIYYPEGWHLYVDGKEVKLGRVNYLLRAAVIPGCNHDQTIVMEFKPNALQKDKASYAFVIILLLTAFGAITWPLWKRFLPEKAKKLLAKAQ